MRRRRRKIRAARKRREAGRFAPKQAGHGIIRFWRKKNNPHSPKDSAETLLLIPVLAGSEEQLRLIDMFRAEKKRLPETGKTDVLFPPAATD